MIFLFSRFSPQGGDGDEDRSHGSQDTGETTTRIVSHICNVILYQSVGVWFLLIQGSIMHLAWLELKFPREGFLGQLSRRPHLLWKDFFSLEKKEKATPLRFHYGAVRRRRRREGPFSPLPKPPPRPPHKHRHRQVTTIQSYCRKTFSSPNTPNAWK